MLDQEKNTVEQATMELPLGARSQYGSLGAAFADIRNYLAGRAIGITQDNYLLDEVIKCLFCYEHLKDQISSENEDVTAETYAVAFDKVKAATNGTFDSADKFNIDSGAIRFIHEVFDSVDLSDPLKDPLSEAYQAFIGSAIRGKEGQFFTPIEAVRWLVEAIDPQPGETVIDPACGAGSFLSFSARHLKSLGASREQIRDCIFGIEKDKYLAKLAHTHLALTTLKAPNIICADSIERKTVEGGTIPFAMDEQFDVVLANPPFGAKIRIGSESTKRKFDLAYKWAKDPTSTRRIRTDKLLASPSPQTLFLELCIKLIRPGGRLGIVVPESMISSPSASYVSQYLTEKTDLLAVVGMPENLFKTSGKGGTHTKTCLVIARKSKQSQAKSRKKIFMAEAKWCGHDSRGTAIPHNDIPLILKNYKKHKAAKDDARLGYLVAHKELVNSNLAPRYYDPKPKEALSRIASSHDFLTIADLVEKEILQFSTGDEVGKLAYGTGTIPFIRTSDISNWEIKIDPKHGVSQEIYEKYASKQDVREGDLLMVRDGTYLIGTCAYLSRYDTKIIYQSHIYKIRVADPDFMSPYLLLASLSSPPVVQQIQSKRVTQDIIDTLGNRVYELVLPIPKNKKSRKQVEDMVKTSIHDRIEARELARAAKLAVVGES